MIIDHLLESDEGVISFKLKTEKKLVELLPPDIAEDARRKKTAPEFYAWLDCRDMGVNFTFNVCDADGRDIVDMELEFPQEMRAEAIRELYAYVEDFSGQDVVEYADDYLENCGVNLSLEDYGGRLRNMDFGEKSFAVRDIYSESDFFGDGVVVSFGKRFPELAENIAESAGEAGFNGIAISPRDGFFCALVNFEDGFEKFSGNEVIKKIDKKDSDVLLKRNYPEIARYYSQVEVVPKIRGLRVRFQNKDGDENALLYIPFKEMKDILAQKDRNRAKPKMA